MTTRNANAEEVASWDRQFFDEYVSERRKEEAFQKARYGFYVNWDGCVLSACCNDRLAIRTTDQPIGPIFRLRHPDRESDYEITCEPCGKILDSHSIFGELLIEGFLLRGGGKC